MGLDICARVIIGLKIEKPFAEEEWWDNYEKGKQHPSLYREEVFDEFPHPNELYVCWAMATKDGSSEYDEQQRAELAMPSEDERVEFYQLTKAKGYVANWEEFEDAFGVYLVVEISE